MNSIRRFTAFCFAALVTFPALASISGSVMNTDGQPVAGAKISLFAPETIDARRARYASPSPQRKPLAEATTDANGTFHVDSPKGQPAVQLAIDANGYAPAQTWALPDEETGAMVLSQATMKNATITANGKGVPNATVIWVNGDDEHVSVTDANGHYSVPDPSKWAMIAVVVHPDFARFEEVTLTGGLRGRRGGGIVENVSPDITLNSGISISGRVVAADANTPAAGADVVLDSWPVAKTASDGTFTIAHAPKNWKTVEAHAGNFVATRAHADGALTLKLTKASAVTGTLLDAKTKLPMPATPLVLRTGIPGGLINIPLHSAITDAKGNFSIAPLAAGAYTLQMNHAGYDLPQQPLSIAAGQSVTKTLYATPHAQVSGTVTDEDHRPVAAARITSRNATREGGPMMMIGRPGVAGRMTWSGPDGRYVLRDVVDAESVIVDAAKKGFPNASSPAMHLASGEKKSGVNLTIPRGVAFTGRVIDKDGKPLSGVAVEATESQRDAMGGAMRRMMVFNTVSRSDDVVRSGADGRFTMRLKDGTYDIGFKRDGFSTKTLRGQMVNGSTKPVDVTLDPGVEITGRVSRGGIGIEGVNVTALGEGGMQTTLTAADGTFRLGDLTPGQMMLNVSKFDAFIMDNRPVSAPAHDINIDLPAGGRITGHVVDKVTHNAVTAFEAGVTTSRSGGGMVVMLPPMLKQFTSDDGSFVLDNVRPGPTQVIANAAGYTTGRAPSIEVEDGKTTSDVEIALETGVRLTGRVADASGTPIAGVGVRNDQSAGGGGRVMRFAANDNGNTVTDPNGEYAIEQQEPGEKTFTFARQGYVSETRTVNLTGKEVRLDVQLSSGMRVGGIVTSDAGAAVADALVRATSASDSMFGREARTDAGGAFTMEGLAPGHYTFSAGKSGFANGILRDVDITTVNPVRITMTSGGMITGHVSGLTADELQATVVTASSTGGGQVSAPVDGSGNYRIEGAPTGTVRVAARSGAMFAGATKSSDPKTVVLDPGGSAQVDIDFKSETVVRGRVTRNGAPLGNAVVMFIPRAAKAQTNASARSDANGAYELSGLDDGPYTVQVVDFERLTPFGTSYDVHGSGTFDIDIRSVTLRGSVVDATTGQPLNDARIDLRSSDAGPFNERGAMTAANGTFTVENVPSGSFQISADKEGYGNDTRTITVGDAAPDLAPFKLAPSDGIVVTVVDARDGNQLAAGVHATDAQGHAYDSGMPFGAPAPVRLPVSAGAYTITVTANGYAQRNLTGIPSPSRQTVALTPGGSVLIRSKSSTAVRARLIDGSGMLYGRTPFNAAGVFRIAASPGTTTLPNVAPGAYTLEVLNDADAVVASVAVVVSEGQAVTVEV